MCASQKVRTLKSNLKLDLCDIYKLGSHLRDFWPLFTLVEKCASAEWWVHSGLTQQALASHSSWWFLFQLDSNRSISELITTFRLFDKYCKMQFLQCYKVFIMRRTSVCTANIWFGKFRIRRPFIFCYCKQSKVWKRLTFWHMAWALDGKKSKAIENSNATSKFMEAPLCPITLRFMTFLAQMLYF